MKMHTLGGALAAVLAMGPPVAASAASAHHAATAHSVVLVPGAFTDKSSWDKVAHLLRKKGFKVTEVDIPLTSLAATSPRPAKCWTPRRARPSSSAIRGAAW